MTTNTGSTYYIPRQFEKLLAKLATYYGQQGNKLLQRIVVNSQYEIYEGVDYTNWNGGQEGHAILFHLPGQLYFEIVNSLHDISSELETRLNMLKGIDGEYISRVTLELQDKFVSPDWREDSGALLHSLPLQVAGADVERLWERDYFRVFISHTAAEKVGAAVLKQALRSYGIAGFVAHEDIEPTQKWQDEIEKALFSMEAFVALLNPNYHQSNWTDQEIGIAMGRGVPIIAIRKGFDPYGFIGKYQAITAGKKTPDTLTKELLIHLIADRRIQQRFAEGLITSFLYATSFTHANTLMGYLEKLEYVTPTMVDRIEQAFTNNVNVKGAFTVQNRLPALLKRLRRS